MKNREIKFRVRDEDSKKILGYEMFNTPLNNGFCFYYENDKEQVLHSEFSTPPMIKGLSSFGRIMREQFTGLTDKNGKEIYESDIVHVIYLDGSDIMGEDADYKDIVYFDSTTASFMIRREIGSDTLEINYLNKSIEVIGDIYENPELPNN